MTISTAEQRATTEDQRDRSRRLFNAKNRGLWVGYQESFDAVERAAGRFSADNAAEFYVIRCCDNIDARVYHHPVNDRGSK